MARSKKKLSIALINKVKTLLSSLMGRQQVERPSPFKAQKKNLASSLVPSNIFKKRSSN